MGSPREGCQLVKATLSETGLKMVPDRMLQDRLAGKRVLVTGATGFIGSHLVRQLASLGANVVVAGAGLGWRSVVRGLVRQGKVRFVDLRTFWHPASLQRVKLEFDGIEYVVHLAYEMPHGRTATEKAIDDSVRNVVGTLRLIQHLPASVAKICFASSVSVYGSGFSLPISETDCPHPATIYAIGKLATESYLRQHAIETGISVSILRYATVYGPMETDPRAIPNFIRQVLAGSPPVIRGDGKDVRDYVHVFDVVQATLLVLASDAHGGRIYNIGSGSGHATREIAEHIIQLAGQQMQPVYRPEECSSSGVVCDISRARGELGYEPKVNLENGLNDEIQWFRNNSRFWM